MRYLDALRVHSAFHPSSTYWIVIKRSRASDLAHCPVIHSSSDHFTFVRVCMCICVCRRKKNKPPLIHVFPLSLTITWKRRGPKPGSTINQISPSRKNVSSSILWNCCVSCHKGIRRGKVNREPFPENRCYRRYPGSQEIVRNWNWIITSVDQRIVENRKMENLCFILFFFLDIKFVW